VLREVATRVAQRGKPQARINVERSRPRLRLCPSRNRREKNRILTLRVQAPPVKVASAETTVPQ